MTWDQFSNLEEEDLRAIVAYVRVLPPVNRTVLIPRPPAANDCETYTFYLERRVTSLVAAETSRGFPACYDPNDFTIPRPGRFPSWASLV